MKKLLIVLSVVLLFACSEEDYVEPPVDTSKPLFELKVGNVWEMKDNLGNSCTLKISEVNNYPWVMSFWDTTKKDTLETYILEQKIIVNNFPQYHNFALAKVKGGILFGDSYHSLIDKQMELPYFVKLFTIPDSTFELKIDRDSTTLKLGEKLIPVVNYAKWEKKLISLPNNVVKWGYEVIHYSKRYELNPGIYGSDYSFADSVGFVRFWQYNLK